MSIILAKILGLYFLAIGLSFVLNPQQFQKYQDFIKSESTMLLGGIVALIIGATVVSLHNIWVFGWPVIITILGWWSLFKGFGILTFPGFSNHFAFMFNRESSFYRLIGLIYMAVGLFLGYHGM